MKNYYCGSYVEGKKKERIKLIKDAAAVIFALIATTFFLGMVI